MKGYLIDSSNNNRVVGFFDTKREANDYIQGKFWTSSENCSFKEFKENFFFVPKKEMDEKVHKYGKAPLKYYTWK